MWNSLLANLFEPAATAISWIAYLYQSIPGFPGISIPEHGNGFLEISVSPYMRPIPYMRPVPLKPTYGSNSNNNSQ